MRKHCEEMIHRRGDNHLKRAYTHACT